MNRPKASAAKDAKRKQFMKAPSGTQRVVMAVK
jgi:hypothetical protein